ncbi:tetratricopeptide repeat protein [Sediminitomix flava]|uniref:Serine phosphatase RsbU (Regulator of sigma subunit) n=1 Tax=Sediminitomix flava TaxID=379075 RepID=A0A315YWK8_SEDFL|nr:tetratricopeptide repeat protein [Sediminitomix flava]PWJ34150.1 serine phosphatase RsbU (regulator of sigma subunit) [Sediminitomix flava]
MIAFDEKLNQSTDQESVEIARARVDELAEKAWRLRGTDRKKAAEYAEEARLLAIANGYEKGEAIARMWLAFVKQLQFSNTSYAIQELKYAYNILEHSGDQHNFSRCLTLHGVMYWGIGEHEKAFSYVLKAYDLNKNAAIPSDRAWVNYLLGSFYDELKDQEQAFQHYEAALKDFEILGDTMGICSSTIGMGHLAMLGKDYERALILHRRALNISEEQKDKNSNARAKHEIGEVYRAMSQSEEALSWYMEALQQREELNNKQGVVTTQTALGELFFEIREYENATQFLNLAVKNAESIDAKVKQLRALKILAETYKSNEAPWEAVETYEQYLQVKSDLQGEEVEAQLKKMRSNFELEKAQQESEIHRLKNVELKEANHQVELQKHKMVQSIRYAERIQSSMLPSLSSLDEYLNEVQVLFRPRDIVSGDFYWWNHINGSTIIAAIDCTGHGVPGAFMSMIANALLQQAVLEQKLTSPSAILQFLHEGVRRALKQDETDNRDGMDVSLITINHREQTLHFAGAKNPLLYFQEGEMHVIKGGLHAVGGQQKETERSFEEHMISLKKPTHIYLFSDGYQDQFGGPEGRKFLRKRFRSLLREIHLLPMDEQFKILQSSLENWMQGYHQTDDILLIGLSL